MSGGAIKLIFKAFVAANMLIWLVVMLYLYLRNLRNVDAARALGVRVFNYAGTFLSAIDNSDPKCPNWLRRRNQKNQLLTVGLGFLLLMPQAIAWKFIYPMFIN